MSELNDNNNNAGGYQEKFIADLRTRLHGKRLHGGTSDPVLYPDWYENQLSFKVKTNVPDDTKNEGVIRFGADNQTSGGALLALMKMISGDEFFNAGKGPDEDHNLAFTRDLPAYNDKPVKEINRLQIGRKNGRYYIAILEQDRPQPVFFFGPSKYHRVIANGQEASQELASGIYAMAWCQNVINAIPLLQEKYYEDINTLMTRWDEKKKGGGNKGGFKGKKQWNNNGNGGGYQKKPWNGNNGGGYKKKQWNNNGGGNGGYQKKQWNNNDNGNGGGNGGGYNANQDSTPDFSDDIPF